jgi:hypothetical protein
MLPRHHANARTPTFPVTFAAAGAVYLVGGTVLPPPRRRAGSAPWRPP